MQYWLVKSEPDTYSYAHLEKDGRTVWDGVRNYMARNNLRAMAQNDEVLFYHSVSGKAVVGVAKVVKTAYPDPKDTTDTWSAVDLAPVRAFKQQVTLEQVKEVPALKDSKLLSHSRLSVQPVTKKEFETFCKLGGI